MKLALGLVSLVAVAGLATACSNDDSPSAQEQFCAQRATISTTIDSAVSSLKDGNFGTAKDTLQQIPDQLKELRTLAGDLKTEVQDEVSAEIDGLESSIEAVKSVTSLAELQTALGNVKDQFVNTLDAIKSAASCS